ncbi:MAG TPA: WD40 repeat domain-containing protein [Candidatus Babeliales bacterium]|nr:WD40 repeat domain-containing protein [Candidatus Babeliales bacterium]
MMITRQNIWIAIVGFLLITVHPIEPAAEAWNWVRKALGSGSQKQKPKSIKTTEGLCLALPSVIQKKILFDFLLTEAQRASLSDQDVIAVAPVMNIDERNVSLFDVSPNGKFLVTYVPGATISVFNIETHELLDQWQDRDLDGISVIKISPEGERVATGRNHFVSLPGIKVVPVGSHGKQEFSFGKEAASNLEGMLHHKDIQISTNGNIITTIEHQVRRTRDEYREPGEPTFLKTLIRAWNVDKKTVLLRMEEDAPHVVVSGDRRKALAWADDKSDAQCKSVPEGELLYTLPGSVTQGAFSADNSLLACVRGYNVEVYDASSGVPKYRFNNRAGNYTRSIAFTGNNDLVITGLNGQGKSSAGVYSNKKHGELLRVFTILQKYAKINAFCEPQFRSNLLTIAGGTRLITRQGEDGAMRVWGARTPVNHMHTHLLNQQRQQQARLERRGSEEKGDA